MPDLRKILSMTDDELDDLLALWRDRLKSEGKSHNTIKAYFDAVAAWRHWCTAGGHDLELTRGGVAAFVASLRDDGKEAATANARHRGLRRFAAFIADEDGVGDPLAGMRPPKLDRKVVPKLNDDELAALIRACDGKGFRDRRDEAIVRLASEAAARAEELLVLTLDDVDTKRGVAIIRRGKGGVGRVVPFGPKTGLAIGRYLRMRRMHARAGEPALWLGERGKAFGYYGLYGALRRRAERAGIEHFHPHRLRHTAASRWLRAGGSEGGLMAIAGWRSRDMLDRYVEDTKMERAAEESRRLGLGDV